MTDFFLRYVEKLKSAYPSAGQLPDLENRLKFLISSHVVTLPKSVIESAEQTVRSIYAYAHGAEHLEHVHNISTPEQRALLEAKAANSSVLMAYDFHYDHNTDQLGLIEVNTNASAFLLTELLYKTAGNSGFQGGLTDLHDAFKSELEFSGKKNTPPCVAIIDEKIPEQKMFLEFLMYKDLFQSWGWAADLQDVDQVKPENYDLIYNRYTDFTFSESRSAQLRSAYLQNETIFSPHPREYLLLANKDRLQDFSKANLSPAILKSFSIKDYPNPETLWEQRKKLFFKPAQLYGAKAVYRGSSISRRMFSEILQRDYIAQEFCSPGEWQGWKYDLRFYVYKDRVQLACARLYQGQVTGFSTPGGGLAQVIFK